VKAELEVKMIKHSCSLNVMKESCSNVSIFKQIQVETVLLAYDFFKNREEPVEPLLFFKKMDLPA